MDSPVCNWLGCDSVYNWFKEKENALKEDEVGACPHNPYTFFGTFFSTFSTCGLGAAICEKNAAASS